MFPLVSFLKIIRELFRQPGAGGEQKNPRQDQQRADDPRPGLHFCILGSEPDKFQSHFDDAEADQSGGDDVDQGTDGAFHRLGKWRRASRPALEGGILPPGETVLIA